MAEPDGKWTIYLGLTIYLAKSTDNSYKIGFL